MMSNRTWKIALAALALAASAKAAEATLEERIAALESAAKSNPVSSLEMHLDATGLYQNLVGREKSQDAGAVCANTDLTITARPNKAVMVVADLNSGVGTGLAARISCLTSSPAVNTLYGLRGGLVTLRILQVTVDPFDGMARATAGLVDPTWYFDRNSVANDERLQFLTAAFVNNPLLGCGLGAGAVVETGYGIFKLRGGVQDLDASGFEQGTNIWSIAEGEAGWGSGALRVFGRAKSRRTYNEQPWAFGASMNQSLGRLGVFARYGREMENTLDTTATVGGAPQMVRVQPDLLKWALSAGAVLSGLVLAAEADKDTLGLAWGVNTTFCGTQEQFGEVYYRWPFGAHLATSLHYQSVYSRMKVAAATGRPDLGAPAEGQQAYNVISTRMTLTY